MARSIIGDTAAASGKPVALPVIAQRDDGPYQVGVDDESALGPFASRRRAEQVASPHLCQYHDRSALPRRAARIRGFRVQRQGVRP